MSPSLLTTKLYIPPPRSRVVPRPRLLQRLEEGLHLGRKLTLISAPAGFGKTTLLSAWVASTDRPVAWVSLDEDDNDPVRFLSYLVAALQTIYSGIGETVLSALHAARSQPPPVEVLLTGLINEIAAVPASPADGSGYSFALVLDDFHAIANPRISEALAFLVDHLPPQMHLVLSSRADPPWSLPRLRARGEMTELRVDDLRFNPPEAATFLNDVMGLALSPRDVAILDARTEGWIAGLQLAALSMRGRDDMAAFIEAFSGSHRFILDYLVEEVLERQPGDVQEFLLRTSILERMTAPLCDAVLGSPSIHQPSSIVLEHLERANLFVVPLDDERRWYRYHHLFADLLRSYLEQSQPDQVPTLHRRASEWYEQNGLVAEAVRHALAAGDVEQVVRLVEGNVLTMIFHGVTTLAGWLDALPNEVVRSRPWLCVARAWTLAYAGQLDAIASLLQDAESALGGVDDAQHVAGHIAVIRAYAASLEGDAPRMAEFARAALERLPEEQDLVTRSFAALTLSVALRWMGDWPGATQAAIEALAISQAVNDTHTTVNVLCELSVLQHMQGQLHEAVATCRKALQLAEERVRSGGRPLLVSGYAHMRMSLFLYELNDLETAIRHAREGIELSKRWGQAEISVTGYIYLALALQAGGDAEGALHAIQEAKRAANRISSWYGALIDVYEARVRLAQGDVAAASRWARESELSIEDEVSYQHEFRYLMLARVLIAQGERRPGGSLDNALRLLERILSGAEAGGRANRVIEILVLQALALQARGEREQAVAVLERALALAEPEGYVRVFVDEGEPMGELLRQAAARGIAADYVGQLLATFDVPRRGGDGSAPTPPHSPTRRAAQHTGARGSAVGRRWPAQQGDRPNAGHRRQHRQESPEKHLWQARRAQPNPGGTPRPGVGLPVGGLASLLPHPSPRDLCLSPGALLLSRK